MFAAALMALVLAAPSPAKECKKDVEFAIRELDKQCGHFFKTKGIAWSKVRKEMLKEAKQVKSDQAAINARYEQAAEDIRYLTELEAQKERLATYRVQARFALATIYDRANATAAERGEMP
jgi:hypothetical protein